MPAPRLEGWSPQRWRDIPSASFGRAAEEHASPIYGRLIDTGTISCAAGRCLAEYWLQDAKGQRILAPLLRSRFAEVIVDEAQDCGREELRIPQFLQQQGTRIIMVGDTDQSIYEFRSATTDRVRMFADSLPAGPSNSRTTGVAKLPFACSTSR